MAKLEHAKVCQNTLKPKYNKLSSLALNVEFFQILKLNQFVTLNLISPTLI